MNQIWLFYLEGLIHNAYQMIFYFWLLIKYESGGELLEVEPNDKV